MTRQAPPWRLTTIVEMGRGLTEDEAYRFLETNVLPGDLDEPDVTGEPAGPVGDSEIIYGEGDALALLAGVPVTMIAAGFDPDQRRDDEGRWTDEMRQRERGVAKLVREALKTHATDKLHSRNYVWSRERDAIQREIASDMYRKMAEHADSDRKAIVAGGLGGSGKTTTLREHAGVDTSRYVIVNPDDVKEELARRGLNPEVPGAEDLSPLELAPLTHRESHRVAKMIMKMALLDGKNVIWDVAMSDVQGTGRGIDRLRDADYEIEAVFVDVPVETAVRRSRRRYAQGVSDWKNGEGLGGRFVPPDLIRMQSRGPGRRSHNRVVFDRLRDEFDTWRLFDNSGSEPKLVRSSDDGDETAVRRPARGSDNSHGGGESPQGTLTLGALGVIRGRGVRSARPGAGRPGGDRVRSAPVLRAVPRAGDRPSTILAAAGDSHWKKQLRAPRGTPIGGQWVEMIGGIIRWIHAPGSKKVKSATIYKKHDAGDVVAVRSDGNVVMRFDGKNYVTESRKSGAGWSRESTLNKKKAYDRLRGQTGEEWREPGTRPFKEGDDENEGLVESRQVEDAPLEVPQPEMSVDRTPIVPTKTVYRRGVADGEVIAENEAGDRVRWDEPRKRFVFEDGDGTETDALNKNQTYQRLKQGGWFEPTDEPITPTSATEPAPAPERTPEVTAPEPTSEAPETSPDVEVVSPGVVGQLKTEAPDLDEPVDALTDVIELDVTSVPKSSESSLVLAPTITPSEARDMQQQMLPMTEWTDGQRKAVRDYTDITYKKINNRLRNPSDTPDEIDLAIASITSVMRPLPQPVQVIRKVPPESVGGVKHGGADSVDISVGDVIENQGLTSSSIDWVGPGGRITLRMHVPAGTPAAYLERVSSRPDEHELLLGPGLRSEVIGVERDGTGPNATMMVDVRVTSPEAKVTSQLEVKSESEVVTPTYEGPHFELPENVASKMKLVDELRDLERRRQVDPKSVDLSRQYSIMNELDITTGNPVYARITQEGHIEWQLGEFRERNGLLGQSDDEVKADLARRAREAFTDKKIAVRVTPGSLDKILEDGRFKSQFESGSSAGLKDLDIRAKRESAWFGYDYTQGSAFSGGSDYGDVSGRPIYGYVALDGVRPVGVGSDQIGGVSTDALSQYGSVQVMLKDDVRRRTTAMFGDSLNSQHQGLPSSIDDPDWRSFTPSGGKAYFGRELADLDRDVNSQRFRANEYAEAQVHGGVTLDDVEEIVFPKTPPKKTRDLLDEKGVSWRVLNLKTVAETGTPEERATALRVAEQDLAYVDERIASAQVDIDSGGYQSKTQEKDLKVLQTQRKNVAGALPALRDAVESDRQSEPQAAQAVPTVGEPEEPTTPEVTKSAPSLRDAYDAGFEVEREFGLGATAQSVELLRLSDGSRAVRKNLRDYTEPAEVQARSEYLAGRVANALGIDDVVTEQLSDYQVLTTFVDGDTGGHAAVARQKEAGGTMIDSVTAIQENAVRRPGGREIGLLDWLITNYDRHNGNYILTTDGRVRPIDHGNAGFRPDTTVPDPKDASKQVPLHTLISPFVDYWIRPRVTEKGPNAQRLRGLNPRFTKSELADVRQRLETIQEFFDRPGESEWYQSLLDRLVLLEAKAKTKVED